MASSDEAFQERVLGTLDQLGVQLNMLVQWSASVDKRMSALEKDVKLTKDGVLDFVDQQPLGASSLSEDVEGAFSQNARQSNFSALVEEAARKSRANRTLSTQVLEGIQERQRPSLTYVARLATDEADPRRASTIDSKLSKQRDGDPSPPINDAHLAPDTHGAPPGLRASSSAPSAESASAPVSFAKPELLSSLGSLGRLGDGCDGARARKSSIIASAQYSRPSSALRTSSTTRLTQCTPSLAMHCSAHTDGALCGVCFRSSVQHVLHHLRAARQGHERRDQLRAMLCGRTKWLPALQPEGIKRQRWDLLSTRDATRARVLPHRAATAPS
jgi:hypothetical protein